MLYVGCVHNLTDTFQHMMRTFASLRKCSAETNDYRTLNEFCEEQNEVHTEPYFSRKCEICFDHVSFKYPGSDNFEKTPAINKFYSYIYTKITGREYAKELRLYNGSNIIEKKSIENADELNKMDNECAVKQFKWGIPGSIMSALSYGVSYLLYGISALKGDIAVSDFVMCITAMETFTNDCLLAIIINTQQLIMKCNFMSAFVAYMNTDSYVPDGEESMNADEFDGIIFENVSFKYPWSEQYILKNISLKIGKGERISIAGLNGAGKSTLVKLICRLYDVTEGAIKINGRNINDYSYEEYIKILAVVFQDFKLFGYSLNENIKIAGGKHSDDDLDNIYAISGIADWVNGMSEKGNRLIGKDFDENGVEPSGGQAQKVAIARALYRDVPVIILDEPTAALDPVAEYEIYNRFNDLINNKTAIYISHRLSSCRFCDKIIVIGDNTIKEMGTHDELIKKKVFMRRCSEPRHNGMLRNKPPKRQRHAAVRAIV